MKEFLRKRWLYIVSLVIMYGCTLALIIEKMISIKTVTSTTAINVTGLIFGLVYLGFVNKKIKKKIADMKPSPFKTFVNGMNGCIPFAVTGCLLYVASNAFDGADITAWCICGCIIIGTVLQVIDAAVNREYLYNREIDELAKKQADIEHRKAQMLAEREAANG